MLYFSLEVFHCLANQNCGHIPVMLELGFNIAFNTVQVISQPVVLWAEETSTYSWSWFCTLNFHHG